MDISFSPVRGLGSAEERAEYIVDGDILYINGEAFDFGPLTEGASLPASAVGSDNVVDTVSRNNGKISVTLVLHHGYKAPTGTLFPAGVTVNAGVVNQPLYEIPPEIEE